MFFKSKKTLSVLILGAAIFISSVIFISRVFSYNDTITHPSLTENIAKVYNKNSDLKLTAQEIEWLKDGSIREDTPPRWMNHFYEPHSGNGLPGYLSSKEWAQSPFYQSLEIFSGGDQTWQKVIDSYVKGDKEEAFFALGHVLHLIEDTTVPAHTRLDAHLLGDPYESWVETEIGSQINFDVLPIELAQLSDAFDSLALYSNNYFLSKDTINKNELVGKEKFFKKVNDIENIECIQGNIGDKTFCLAVVRSIAGEENYFLDVPIVHSDYFSLLAPKAVSYGAGVIKLFFEEAERQKQLEQQKSWWEKVEETVTSQFKLLFAGPSSLITYETEKVPETTTQPTEPTEEPVGPSAPSPPPTPLPSEPSPIPLPPSVIGTVPITQPTSAPPEIQEEISKPEIPSEITEKKFSPIIPPQSAPQPLVPPKVGGGPGKEVATSSQPISTSTLSVPPEVDIYLSGYTITARSFTVNWHSSSTNLSTYDVDRKYEGGNWQNWEIATTSTSKIFEVPQDQTTYYFRARGTNSDGISGDWQEISAPIYFYPVVINEIAWAGTSASTSADEWMELFNKTNQPIDLSGWILKSLSDNSPNSTTTGIIGAAAYFLLERTDDDTIIDLSADQIYTGGLNNTGEILELRDNFSNLIDRIPLSDTGKWMAGIAGPNYQSMERVNPYVPADIQENWQSNSTSTRNGLNVDGQPINGTPKAQNSVFNLEFFYLYPAKDITATSTILEWTPSYINNFKEYRVSRASGFSSTTFDVIAIRIGTNFFDQTLESETQYYYKILACDISDSCVESNNISLITPEFPFLWSSPQIISGISTSTEALPEIAIGDIGLPAVAWYTYKTVGNRFINFSQKNSDGNWSEPEKTAKEYYPYGFPSQILKRGSDFEILFTGDKPGEGGTPYDIFSWRSEAGAWQAPINILAGDDSYMQSGVIDETGITHIVWIGMHGTSSATAILYRALAGDSSFLGDIQEIPGSEGGLLPQIAVDDENKLHVIWFHWPGIGNLDGIFYSSNSQDGSGWSQAKQIALIDKPGPLPKPSALGVDENSHLLVAWEQAGQIHQIKFDGATSTPKTIFSQLGGQLDAPEIVFNRNKKPYLFFNSFGGLKKGIYFSFLKNNGQWSGIKKVFEFDYEVDRPKGAVDSNNILHLVWEGENPNSQIYYTFGEIE